MDITSQVAHGDLVRLEGEMIYAGRSSAAVQVTGYRHDIETGQFVHTLSAIMTCVAMNENLRPIPAMPKLRDPENKGYLKHLEATAEQRKDLSQRWQSVQDTVDQMPHISRDMIVVDESLSQNWSQLVAVPETLVEVQNSFLPKHLNRNNTIFGGEVLNWMVSSSSARCGDLLACMH